MYKLTKILYAIKNYIVFIALFLLSIPAVAIVPAIIGMLAGAGGVAWLSGWFSSGDTVVSDSGSFSIAGDMFVGFYDKLNLWLFGGVYDGLCDIK